MLKTIKPYLMHIVFIQACIAVLGSLFFSEILKFPPCILCWYQRIFMYPIVLIMLVSFWKKDKNAAYYVLPLAIIGALISVYHNLLYYHILPESIAPCTTGVSCTTKFIEFFGFVTIPFLSLIGFLIIIKCCLLTIYLQKKSK